jgi:hypothetical protein
MFKRMFKNTRTTYGPSGKLLRKYILPNICVYDVLPVFIDDILLKYIPDIEEGDTKYGSWKCFDIFGIDYRIYCVIRREIKQYKKAINILKLKFIPLWLENAYKLDGCMYRVLVKQTLVGK